MVKILTEHQKKVRNHFKYKKWLLKDSEFWHYVHIFMLKK